jgi:hypothetical protein
VNFLPSVLCSLALRDGVAPFALRKLGALAANRSVSVCERQPLRVEALYFSTIFESSFFNPKNHNFSDLYLFRFETFLILTYC